MDYEVAFYIHHHGSGHIMSALSMARAFTDKKVSFLGSNLAPYRSIIPHQITCLHLPLDIASVDEIIDEKYEQCKNFLYAPLNVSGIKDRNVILTGFFASHPLLLFIVDSSPEMVALARLCSVPTIVVQQHGKRNDLPHQLAYDSAVKIMALFPEDLSPHCPDWVKEKTLFTGGFSRFEVSESSKRQDHGIGILVGSGGSSLDFSFINHLASVVPQYLFKAIGNIEINKYETECLPHNLIFTGLMDDPRDEMEACELIIGNCGHNTVMEVATINKRFICIPEERPFSEQLDKAEKIKEQYGVNVVLPENLFTANWNVLIEEALQTPVGWKNMINPNAASLIRSEFDQLANGLFYFNPC